MEPTDAAAVRALAAWLHARRELTERVDVLLMHGPTAVQRVRRHLDEVREAYARELAAFDAFAGDGPPPPVREQLPAARDEVDLQAHEYPPLRSVVLPP